VEKNRREETTWFKLGKRDSGRSIVVTHAQERALIAEGHWCKPEPCARLGFREEFTNYF